MVKDTTDARSGSVATGTAALLFFGLAWLGAAMYTTHATITGHGENLSGALGTAAAALPGVGAAMLGTGAAFGAVAGRHRQRAGGRLRAGLAWGALAGLSAAAGVRFAYGDGPSIPGA